MAADVLVEVQGYVRYPTVCKNQLAFIAEDDLWCCPATGGCAQRLTSGLSPLHPLFAPAGDCIAFTVHSDVWVLNFADRRHRQLTWFGWGEAQAVSWAEGGRSVIVASSCADPFGRKSLYRVHLSGGVPDLLYAGGEFDTWVGGIGDEGSGVLLGRHTQDAYAPNTWKGYRGGKYGCLWFDAHGVNEFKKIELQDPVAPPGVRISISCPMWLEGRIWFVADHDGSANIWSMDLDGQGLTKHTAHDFFDVRAAKTDGTSVVYTHAGELWFLQADASEPCRVRLEFGATTSHLPRYLNAGDWCDGVALHPDAHHCAVMCRGQVFEMALWEGPAVRLRPPGAAAAHDGRVERCVAFEYLFSGRLLTLTDEMAPFPSFTIHPNACMPDSDKPSQARQWLSLFMSDIGIAAQRVILGKPIGQVLEMSCSPVHDAVVLVTARNELLLVEFVGEGGDRPNPQVQPYAKADTQLQVEVKTLDKGEWEEGISEPCWSPDGEWIAYIRKDGYYGSSVVLLSLETGQKTVVADSSFSNSSPCFDPDGNYLSFISARTFAPLEDDVTMDLSFSVGAQLPYLALLQKDARNPFQRVPLSPSEAAAAAEGGDDQGDDGGDEDDDGESETENMFVPPEKIQVDAEGIERRILRFPVPVGKYGGGQWNEEGKFQYLRGSPRAAQQNVVGPEEDEAQGDASTLFVFDFTTLKEKKLATNIIDFQLSMDLKNMLTCVREEGEEEYRVHVAGQKPPQEDEELEEDINPDEPGAESGILDIDGRISLEVVPLEEWGQIFEEIRHHVNEHFYDEAHGGVDWNETCDRYRSVLPRLRCRSELTDLCNELLAELGVSHVSLSEPQASEDSCKVVGHQGTLGLTVSWRELAAPGSGGAWHVDKMLKGDTWDPRYSGPASRPCVGVAEGSLIIAVNRVRVCRSVSLDQMLANLGKTEVFLTFVPPEGVADYEKVQALLAQSGGVDGFRRLGANQQKIVQEQSATAKKKGRNRKKTKEKAKQGKSGASSELAAAQKMLQAIEKKMAEVLSSAGIEISGAPMWNTVRVCTCNEMVAHNAALRDVVEKRSAIVHEATVGRVGYIHVPDTSELGYAEFYRYYSRECDRQALIVDLRCNAGGFAAELMLKKLGEVPLGWSVPRAGRGRPTTWPALCPPTKMVVLVDEHTSSDGECWAAAFQKLNLGKVVGVRTWGGVVEVGAADVDLLDGAELVLPAAHCFLSGGVGYDLENFGVQPDVSVEVPPSTMAGDPQLSEAISQALKLLDNAEDRPQLPVFPATRLHRKARGQL